MREIIYRFDPHDPHPVVRPADPAQSRARLEAGNAEFAALLGRPHDDPDDHRVVWYDDLWTGPGGAAPTQVPFAAALGCSDARVPLEIVFGQGFNDLFVVRVAGNVLGDECLGSLDFAFAALGDGLKLVVVLGHTGCGAVTAAVDAFLVPSSYLAVAHSHPLRAVVDRIMVSVRGAQKSLEATYGAGVSESPGYRKALIEVSVGLNAAVTAATLQHEFHEQLGPHRQVVFGVYDLVTRSVGLPGAGGFRPGLVAPPADTADFVELATRFATAPAVRGLVG
jgi:carbonic anhydrase